MEKNLFQKEASKWISFIRGKGCPQCKNSGYRGRLAIHEVLMINDQIRSMMMNHKPITEMKQYLLKNGMIFLLDDGLLKAKSGLTTVEEVLRVAVRIGGHYDEGKITLYFNSSI